MSPAEWRAINRIADVMNSLLTFEDPDPQSAYNETHRILREQRNKVPNSAVVRRLWRTAEIQAQDWCEKRTVEMKTLEKQP